MRKFVLYPLPALLLLPCIFLHAQLLPIRNYTMRQGLNANSINAVLRDSRGMLWVGTYNGLNLYDGARFLQPAMTTRGSQIYVTALTEDSHHQVWAATWYSGLYKYSGGIFTNYLPDTANPSSQVNNITAIVQLDDSTWVTGTDKNALLFDGRRFTPLDPANALLDQQIHSLVRTPSGDILIGLPQGIAVYRHTAAHWHYTGLLLKGTDINNMSTAGKQLWITSDRGLLYYPCVDSALAGATPHLLVAAPVDNVFPIMGSTDQAPSDCWYTQGNGGAWRIHDGRIVQHLTHDNGLPSSFIKAICTDAEGITWLGTEYGLGKLTPAGYRFFPVTESDGPKGSDREVNVIALTKEHNDGLLLGTYSGIYRLQAGRATQLFQPGSPAAHHHGLPTAQPFGYVFALLRDRHDRLWACTGNGLFCRESETGAFQKRHAATISGASIDPSGTGWFGSMDGRILRLDDKGLHELTPVTSPHERITALHADAHGFLWVGYYQSGLFKFRIANDTLSPVQSYTRANGYDKLLVRSIAALPNGQILVGSRTNGLYFFEPVRPPLTREQGLSGNWVKDILARGNDVYLATNNGLDTFDATSTTPSVHHHDFNQEGIPAELNDLLFHSDTFWLGTSRGVLEYIPETQKPNAVPPPVYAMRVLIDGRVDSSFVPFTETDSLPRLDYLQNNLSFDFAALSFRDEDNIRYRYKLEGVDAVWSAPTDRRYVNYGNLPPGSYRFLVIAVTGDGIRSSRPAAISFVIAAPFWRTTWFLLLCTFALAAAVYGIYRIRLHQLLRIEKLRARISTDLHDDIGSTLSSISILSDMAIQEEEVRNGPFTTPHIPAQPDSLSTSPAVTPAQPTTLYLMIREIRDNSLSLLEKMDDIVWSINPRNDTLESLLLRVHRFGAHLFEATGIEYEIEIEPGVRHLRLRMEDRQNLYLITKEAINNLVKYAEARKAHIRARAVRHALEVQISDDGRGFDQTLVQPGNGIINMKSRAAAMKATLQIGSSPGKGTTVTLTLKIS